MKKITILLVAIFGLLLGGCGSDESYNKSQDDPGSDVKITKIDSDTYLLDASESYSHAYEALNRVCRKTGIDTTGLGTGIEEDILVVNCTKEQDVPRSVPTPTSTPEDTLP